MRKISVLLALAVLFVAHAAFAKAVVTSATGNVQAQAGTGTARALRLGDEVNQGDTVSTGPASSVVLRFEDGQVAALTANSRMTVTAYQYNAQARSGNILLSLVTGGMRAITGLIGRAAPDRVSYRAANATIGIRGTDINVATVRDIVVAIVTEGEISVTIGDKTYIVKAGEGINARTDGTFQRGAAEEIVRQLPPDLVILINGVNGLAAEIRRAAQGAVRFDGTPNSPAGPQGGGNSTASPS